MKVVSRGLVVGDQVDSLSNVTRSESRCPISRIAQCIAVAVTDGSWRQSIRANLLLQIYLHVPYSVPNIRRVPNPPTRYRFFASLWISPVTKREGAHILAHLHQPIVSYRVLHPDGTLYFVLPESTGFATVSSSAFFRLESSLTQPRAKDLTRGRNLFLALITVAWRTLQFPFSFEVMLLVC